MEKQNTQPSKEKKPNVDKEIAVVKGNASKALAAANAMIVNSPESLAAATELLTNINKAGDMLKKLKEGITKPLNEALKSARALFSSPESEVDNAQMIVKQKMLAYHTEQRKKDEAEKARLAARVEKGTMRMDTAVKKMENMPAIQTKVVGNTGGSVVFKDEKKVVITDESLIPRQFLVVDMVAVRKAALAGMEIPGVKIEIVQNLANQRA